MGLLDGDLASAIYEGFKGRLLSGNAYRSGAALSSGEDEFGDPTDTDRQSWAVQGFIESYSRHTRAQAGIPDSDVKVSLFSQSAPDYVPKKDDLVALTGATVRWVRLVGGPLDIDPAGALWTLQATEIGAPSWA